VESLKDHRTQHTKTARPLHSSRAFSFKNQFNMQPSLNDYDVFLEWEAQAEEEIKILQEKIKAEPENQEIRAKIEEIKKFWSKHSSSSCFRIE
jgi:hypothetical protein